MALENCIIDDDVKITINLNKLVDIRARLLTQREGYSEKIIKGEYLDENDIDRIATKLRDTLTWDALFYMIDDSILESGKNEKTKFQHLKPLLLILTYIFIASILMNYNNWNLNEAMLDFMGLFYIVFSFFKMLDLKGFPESFMMYDPLAKRLPIYGKVYPFIETGLGLMLLMRFEVKIALIITLFILGVTTVGVTKILLDRKSIRCACLGTVLNLPMTEATFIENVIMIVMAISMLINNAYV